MRFFRNAAFLVMLLFSSLQACRVDVKQQVEPTVEAINQPLPPYLDFVAPQPEEVLSLEAYREGAHFPGSRNPAEAHEIGRNRICLELQPTASLLEPGDHFVLYPDEGTYLPDRVSLSVDGLLVERKDEVSSLPYRFELHDEEGEDIATAPALQLFCWVVDLEVGDHISTVSFQRTSGAIVTYTWSFEIN
jgi:hypothetical protein